jgi:hypothetical protein
MKMETTHVSETSTLYNHTPGNYPKEDNIHLQSCFSKAQLCFSPAVKGKKQQNELDYAGTAQ